MAGPQLWLICIPVCCALVVFKHLYYNGKRLPPSPPGHPVIGHLLKFSPARQYELFRDWAAQYGDIFCLNLLGQTLVVVNSLQVATALLEKRSANYSDRPPCHAFELVGYERNVVITPYGERFRKHRKMFQESLSKQNTGIFQSIQERQARIFLERLLGAPTGYHSSSQIFALSVVLELAYGHRVDSEDHPYVKLVQAAAPGMDELAAGVTLVDFLPFLARIPRWVPGAPLVAGVVHRWRTLTRKMFETPFNDALGQLAAGTAATSFSTLNVQQLSQEGELPSYDDLKDIEGAAGAFLAAGMETTWTSIQIMILAMILFPEVQHKAQEEIDRVVGQDRLPDFNDYDDLPYIRCLIEEVIRWHPAAPLGVPHRSLAEDVYNGMRIPARAMVIPNVQVMSKDPAMYKNPDEFYPERFLPSPTGYGEPHFDPAFGFGRRICPGRHLAKDSIWIVAATLLATFTIGKSVDAVGTVIEPVVEFVTGAQTSPPKRFECSIMPRSDSAEKLIRHNAAR